MYSVFFIIKLQNSVAFCYKKIIVNLQNKDIDCLLFEMKATIINW